MCIAVSSFQMRTQKRIVAMQLVSQSLFAVHYFLLGEYVGAGLNLIGSVRCCIYVFRGRKWADSFIWVVMFTLASLSTYVLRFTVLGAEHTAFNFIIQSLPVLGMISNTFAQRMKEARLVRIFSLISMPLWLIYNAVIGSIGGCLTEIISITSVIVGMIRLDRKKKQQSANLGAVENNL